MCEHKNDLSHEVKVKLDKPDYRGRNHCWVDRCIAPIVQALQDAGIKTDASCCGHGYLPITIALEGEKWLVIFEDNKSFHRAMEPFKVNIAGEKQ